MTINNLHQPYIFKYQNEINLIVSKFLPEKFIYNWSIHEIKEDRWKLYYLDSNYNETEINTPSSIEYNGINYEVVQECNGFVWGDKISYIIGGFNSSQSKHIFVLVEGDFDFNTKIASNLEIKSLTRTGFTSSENIYVANVKNSNLYQNDILVADFSSYLNFTARVIPVFQSNYIIFTGNAHPDFKSFVLDSSNGDIFKLKTTSNNDVIYKSSIFTDGDTTLLAYTDKVFSGDSQVDYVLNIVDGYNLEKIN